MSLKGPHLRGRGCKPFGLTGIAKHKNGLFCAPNTSLIQRLRACTSMVLVLEHFPKNSFGPLLGHFSVSKWVIFKGIRAWPDEPFVAHEALPVALRTVPVAVDATLEGTVGGGTLCTDPMGCSATCPGLCRTFVS